LKIERERGMKMNNRKMKCLILILVMLLTASHLSALYVQAVQPVTIKLNGKEEKDYAMVNVSDIPDPEVFTGTDTDSMVYAEEDIQQETSESRMPASNTRAVGDVTITFNGQVRVNYTTVGVDDTREVKAYVEGETIQSIQWSSDNNSVVSISGDKDGATLTAKSIGVATITAKIETNNGNLTKDIMVSTRTSLNMTGYANANADMHQAANESSNVSRNISKGDILEIRGQNGNYYWVSYDDASGFVLKSKVNIPAVELTLDKEYITLKKSGQDTIHTEVLPDLYTGTITWNSNKTDVATVSNVSNNGKVAGIKEGAAKVYATAEGMNGNIQAGCTVSIWTELNEMEAVTSSTVNGKKGAVSDSAGTESVDKGTSVMIIGQCGDYYYVRLTGSSMVFIEKSALVIKAASITLNSENITIGIGETYQLTAKILPDLATDKKVLWSSVNSNVAKVDANGKITGVKQGTTYVEARTGDGTLTAECRVNIQENKVFKAPSINSIEVFSIVPECQSVDLTVRINANFNKDVTYEIILFNDKRKKAWSYLPETMPTNFDQDFLLIDLDYNKKYYVKIKVTYKENGKEKTKESGMFGFKTKKPKVALSVNKAEKSSLQLKMETTPKKLYGTTFQIRYKLKGNKTYTTLDEKEYSKKGSIIQIYKNLLPGKTYIFEVVISNLGKLVCKDTVNVKTGYTSVKVKANSNLTKITVSWEKIASAKGYEIYRSEQKGKPGKKVKTIKEAGATSYVEYTKNLKNGKTYYYQVLPYWTENKKKKTGSSNQANILCRKIDTAVNKKVLLEDMKLKDLIAVSSQSDMNSFPLAAVSSPADMNSSYLAAANPVTDKSETCYPAIKYQFNGKKLTIHLYIEYSSYRFNNKFHADGTPDCTAESISTVKNKARKNGKKYINLFQKGLKKYYHNQWVQGTKRDFGNKVNFKTALVIHRKDNSKENYHQDQQFIEVMIGGINKYYYSKDIYSKDVNPYWYHALSGSQKIYIPEEGQFTLNAGKNYQSPVSDYKAASAHIMGHILGLGDAWYDDVNGTERCTENKETCIYENGMYYNMMKSSNKGFTANDFEMMLRAYQKGGKVVTQYYKTYDKVMISDVIKNKTAH